MRTYKIALATAAGIFLSLGAATAAETPSQIFNPEYRQFTNEVITDTTAPARVISPRVSSNVQKPLNYQRCQEAMKSPSDQSDVFAYCSPSDLRGSMN